MVDCEVAKTLLLKHKFRIPIDYVDSMFRPLGHIELRGLNWGYGVVVDIERNPKGLRVHGLNYVCNCLRWLEIDLSAFRPNLQIHAFHLRLPTHVILRGDRTVANLKPLILGYLEQV